MNKVILLGNIGKMAELKTTQQARILNFTLATKDVNDTDWHKCVAFNNVADVINKHCKVGDKICVEGKIKYRDYEVDGVKKKSAEIFVSNIEFASSKHTTETKTEAPAQPTTQASAPGFVTDNNGDLPF